MSGGGELRAGVSGVVLDEGAFLVFGGVFCFDFLLQFHEAFDEGFWAWRAARDVDVYGDEAVDALEDGVGAIHAA